MAYDYLEAMKEDIKEYIDEEINVEDYEGNDELEEHLNDSLWIEDSVTGNASGSYTFNSEEAKRCVKDNMSLLKEALREFDTDKETIADKFLKDEWEWFDVTIRCYLLAEAIGEVLDEMGLYE